MISPRIHGADRGDELPPWPKGYVIQEPYKVKDDDLGRGGMGRVYLVEDRHFGHQFAVKRALLRNPEGQRGLIKELQRWIGLPPHPHLVACRFFRTIKTEIVIFAEYVPGLNLAQAIAARRLTGLDQLLDIATQCAWGLQAIHDHGLVHADVKSQNVLLTPQGDAKIADLGIARAGAMPEEGSPRPFPPWITVGGGTRPYRSPEQAANAPLTHASDLWSWGLTVVEMFNGGCTWDEGGQAPTVLEQYLHAGPAHPALPAMPLALVDLLRRCFHPDPARRWSSLAEAAEALIAVYQGELGQPYQRPRPPSPAHWGSVAHDRRSPFGTEWADPREWLRWAVAAAGRDQAEAESLFPTRGSSRTAQAIADLAGYAEAHRLIDELIAAGRRDLEPALASLCMHRSLVYQATHDMPVALAAYDQALAIYERLAQEGRGELANELAAAYGNKADALRTLGDHPGALAAYDQALAIYERLVQEGCGELRGDLAWARLLRAGTLRAVGDVKRARAEARAAIPVLQAEVERTRRADLQQVLQWARKALGDLL